MDDQPSYLDAPINQLRSALQTITGHDWHVYKTGAASVFSVSYSTASEFYLIQCNRMHKWGHTPYKLIGPHEVVKPQYLSVARWYDTPEALVVAMTLDGLLNEEPES